jgi:hypothetical protein
MFGAPTTDFNDEIDFWSRQLQEHCLFVHLDLHDMALKTRAQELYQLWDQFRQHRKNMPSAEVAGHALGLALDTRGLLVHVHDRLTKGQWIGNLFPLFVDHVRREGDYFIEIMQHKASDTATTYKNWLVFMAEHAAFTAHLLDPTESAKIRQATAFIGEFERLHNGCGAINAQLIQLTETAGKELDSYFAQLGVGTPKLRSIIHPVLAEHVIREGKRFLMIIDKIKIGVASIPSHTSSLA